MGDFLEIGKLPNSLLESLVLNKIKNNRQEVLVGSSIGEDTAVLDMGENYIIISCDPITGSNSNIGKLGVHISVNDISTKGAEPVGILLTLLLPPNTKQEEISQIMKEVEEETESLNMDIIGGHTEITTVVNKPVLVTTVVGKVKKDEIPNKEIIQPGFIVAMSKTAGLEGTAIIAHDKAEELKGIIPEQLMKEAISQLKNISVLKEGKFSRKYRIGYMHDVTESGIEGAIWEASEAIEYGLLIEKDKIPLLDSTKEICNFFKIDPYKLISSGSMLLIIDPMDYESYKKDLNRNNILLSQIGLVTAKKGVKYSKKGSEVPIDFPGPDELYKVI